MSREEIERRKHQRIPITARVIVVENKRTFYLFTRDLSLGGARMISDDTFQIGQMLLMEIAIAGVNRLIKVNAEVARHINGLEKGFAVKFLRFRPYSRKRLQLALEALSEG